MNRIHALLAPALFALLGATVAVAQASDADAATSGGAIPAPATEAPPSDAYRIGPQDVIEVFVWKEPDLSTEVTVRPDGRITLPLAGEIDAQEKTAGQLKDEIVGKLQQYIAEPVVTVMVKEANSRQVSVLGEVKRPGRYRIGEQATILDAIALGGGMTEYAHPGDVVVFRRTRYGTRKLAVDVKHLLRTGRDAFVLQPGDTIYVR